MLGTTLSIPFELLLAVLGSRTTSRNPVVYQLARGVMSLLRAVPDVVFALIFVTAVGLGPFPGVLALIVHNAGVMGKLWSEAMEETDHGPVEALRVVGLVGAGGIGLLINQSIQLFQFDAMFTYILQVLVMIIAVDLISIAVRRRLAA